jgi:Spy/CpxP family protein refolding chaperone
MKMRKIIAAALLSAAIIGGSFTSAFAQDKSCCDKKGQEKQQCGPGGPGCNIPDLTKDQIKQIDALKMTLVKDQIALKNQVAEKQAHLKTLSMQDNPDMGEINKTIDEMYVLKAQLAKAKEAHIQDVRKILTPEQRLFFDMKHAENDKCGRGGPEGMGCPKDGGGCQNMGPGCPHQGQGCQGMGQGAGCKQQGQGCQGMGQGAGCKQQGQGCQGMGQGAGCKQQGQGCQGMGQGAGCKQQGQGCQGMGQGDQKQGEGCKHMQENSGGGCQHQQNSKDADDKK